jgi:hypothetical protein
MPTTTLSTLWTPVIWVKAVNEKARTFPSFLTSGAVRQSDYFDQLATGGGLAVNLPLFKDITEQDDAPQVESTAPTMDGVTGGVNVAPILSREKAWEVTALAAGITGEDVVGAITDQLALRRQKQRHKTVISILQGLFGTALVTQKIDAFSETGASPPASALIDVAKINQTIALAGERSGDFQNGAILMHPAIHAALKTIDANSFSTDPPSAQGFAIRRYQGIPVYESAWLGRAGTTSGIVYTTYVAGPGAIAWGEKPQAPDQIDVASLQFYERKDLNNMQILDRTRFILHVNGTRYGGALTAAGGPNNTALATAANWTYIGTDFGSPPVPPGVGLGIPIACLRTNG